MLVALLTKWQPIGCLALAFLAALAVAIGITAMADARLPTNKSSSARTAGEVTLRAAAGHSLVPMSDGFAIDSRTVQRFADGTRCIKLDGPLVVTIAGMQMEFYRLECNGQRGYVNAKWVSRT